MVQSVRASGRRLLLLVLKDEHRDDDDDDDEEDDEYEDGSPSWLGEDDQDDGIKGQDIVEPDYDDELSRVIRIDEARIPYAIPRDE